MYTYTVNILPY